MRNYDSRSYSSVFTRSSLLKWRNNQNLKHIHGKTNMEEMTNKVLLLSCLAL